MKPVFVFFVALVLMIFLATAQIGHNNPVRLHEEEHRVRPKRHLLNKATSVGRKVLNVGGAYTTQEANLNQGYSGTFPDDRHHYYSGDQRPTSPHN
jgi:hypothetical protein